MHFVAKITQCDQRRSQNHILYDPVEDAAFRKSNSSQIISRNITYESFTADSEPKSTVQSRSKVGRGIIGQFR